MAELELVYEMIMVLTICICWLKIDVIKLQDKIEAIKKRIEEEYG